MDYMLLFIISATINIFAVGEFWVFWIMARRQYEGMRNFFLRNAGFGYLIIRHPEGRIEKKFKKLKETMDVGKGKYSLKSDRVYRFEGLPALFYNKGDHMPIKFEDLKKDELWANAEWFDNLCANIKAAAEAEAEAKTQMSMTLLWIIAGCIIILVGLMGYGFYMVQSGEVVVQMKP